MNLVSCLANRPSLVAVAWVGVLLSACTDSSLQQPFETPDDTADVAADTGGPSTDASTDPTPDASADAVIADPDTNPGADTGPPPLVDTLQPAAIWASGGVFVWPGIDAARVDRVLIGNWEATDLTAAVGGLQVTVPPGQAGDYLVQAFDLSSVPLATASLTLLPVPLQWRPAPDWTFAVVDEVDAPSTTAPRLVAAVGIDDPASRLLVVHGQIWEVAARTDTQVQLRLALEPVPPPAEGSGEPDPPPEETPPEETPPAEEETPSPPNADAAFGEARSLGVIVDGLSASRWVVTCGSGETPVSVWPVGASGARLLSQAHTVTDTGSACFGVLGREGRRDRAPDALVVRDSDDGPVLVALQLAGAGQWETSATLLPLAGPALDGVRAGVTLALADLDGDTKEDLLVVVGDAVWMQRDIDAALAGEGTSWVQVITAAGRIGALATLDLQQDGDTDVFLALADGQDELWQNDGFGAFASTTRAALPYDRATAASVWVLDADRDGFADLVVGNRGQSERLYRNRQDGRFADVSPQLGIDSAGASHTLVLDANRDGGWDVLSFGAGDNTPLGLRLRVMELPTTPETE